VPALQQARVPALQQARVPALQQARVPALQQARVPALQQAVELPVVAFVPTQTRARPQARRQPSDALDDRQLYLTSASPLSEFSAAPGVRLELEAKSNGWPLTAGIFTQS
jgi:hypothetical protein